MHSLEEVKEKTYKKRDAWWTVFLVDPLASRLVLPLANHTRVTPNQISLGAFLLGCVAAWFFFRADPVSLCIGAVLFHFSFVLDCMDGKIARLKGTGSIFGMWLDYMLDRVRVVVCGLALMAGQFQLTGDLTYLALAIVIIFMDMLRYMDALQLYKLRREMRKKIRQAKRDARQTLELEGIETWEEEEESDSQLEEQTKKKVDLNQAFKKKFGWYLKVRDRLEEARVRPHLFSGIEFQMFVFIVGPITGLIMESVVISAIILFVFELAIIYKMWLSTRDLQRELEQIQSGEFFARDHAVSTGSAEV